MLYQKKYFQFILILLLFEPNIFVKFPVFNYLYIAGGVYCFAYCTYIYYVRNIPISKLLVLFVIQRVILFFPTIIYEGDILKWGYQSIIIISIFMLSNLCLKDNSKKYISNIKKIFILLLFINIFLYIKYPKGLYSQVEGLNFLGIRTRFTDYAFPAIAFVILDSKLNKTSMINTILSITIILLNIVLPSISTAIVGIACFTLMYLFGTRLKVCKYTYISILFFIFNFLIVQLRIQSKFEEIFIYLFNKSATLTGRTEIWDLSYDYIFDKILFGHGMVNDGNFVLWHGDLWQSHNQILQILYDGGIISFFIIIAIIIELGRNIRKNSRHKVSIILNSCLFGFFIMMISEIYLYYPPIYLIFSIVYGVDKIISQYEMKDGIVKHNNIRKKEICI